MEQRGWPPVAEFLGVGKLLQSAGLGLGLALDDCGLEVVVWCYRMRIIEDVGGLVHDATCQGGHNTVVFWLLASGAMDTKVRINLCDPSLCPCILGPKRGYAVLCTTAVVA